MSDQKFNRVRGVRACRKGWDVPLRLGALVASLFALGHPAFESRAETPKAGTATRRKVAPVGPTVSEGTFDPNVTRLPRGFTGHSIEKYVQAVEPPVRGEFETSADFEQRSKRRKPAGVYAFLLDTRSDARLRFTYDADDESFIVQIVPEREVWRGNSRDRELSALLLKEAVLSTSEYVAQNSYGASTTVLRTRTCEYALLPSSWSSATPLTDFRVSVPRQDAPRVKESLRVLAVFRASGSLDDRESGRQETSPTLNRPREEHRQYEYVRGDLLAFLVYDISDGRVLGRYEVPPE